VPFSTVDGNGPVNIGYTTISTARQFVLQGTILAGGSPNCAPGGTVFGIVDNGWNLDDGQSCRFSSTRNDVVGLPAQLGPLQSNGGPVQTQQLLTGSPAIDAGGTAAASGCRFCVPSNATGCASRPEF